MIIPGQTVFNPAPGTSLGVGGILIGRGDIGQQADRQLAPPSPATMTRDTARLPGKQVLTFSHLGRHSLTNLRNCSARHTKSGWVFPRTNRNRGPRKVAK